MAVTITGNNTPTAGGVTYGDGTTYATTAAGTSGQVLQSNGASAPTWVASPSPSAATPTALGTVFGTTANQNAALGSGALNSATTAATNVAIGYQALYTGTTLGSAGGGSVAVGWKAGYSMGNVGYFTALGNQAGYSCTTEGVFIGYQAGFSNTTGDSNTALGGYNTLYSNTTGSKNTALGREALTSNTTGSFNTAAGKNALYANTTGAANTAFGYSAMEANTTANSNTAVGYTTFVSNTTGENNTAIGRDALYSNTTANASVAIGYRAGKSITTGGNCTLVGADVGGNLTTGIRNTFVGTSNGSTGPAGYLVTTGSDNIILGGFDGNQGGLDIRTSSNNIVLSDGSGALAARWASGGGWYQLNNSATWSITSDARIKKNIVSLESGLSVIQALRPVEFDYIENDKHDIGFIAQEYQTVLPAQVEEGNNGMLSLNQNLVPYLVKAIQELKAEVDSLKSQLQGN